MASINLKILTKSFLILTLVLGISWLLIENGIQTQGIDFGLLGQGLFGFIAFLTIPCV